MAGGSLSLTGGRSKDDGQTLPVMYGRLVHHGRTLPVIFYGSDSQSQPSKMTGERCPCFLDVAMMTGRGCP